MEGPFLFNNLLRARGTVLLEQLIMSQGDSSSGKINCEPGDSSPGILMLPLSLYKTSFLKE